MKLCLKTGRYQILESWFYARNFCIIIQGNTVINSQLLNIHDTFKLTISMTIYVGLS